MEVILCAKGQHQEGNYDEFVDRNGKLREITNNNRHERVLVKAIVMENTNPVNHSISTQNLLLGLEIHLKSVQKLDAQKASDHSLIGAFVGQKLVLSE